MRLFHPVLVTAALAGCATPATPPAPAPTTIGPDTITVWVTDAQDTLTLHADSLAHLLNAVALRWAVADTADVSVLAARGILPLVAHGPFRFAAGVPTDSVTLHTLPSGWLYALVSDSMVPVAALSDSTAAAAIRDDLARFAVTADVAPSITTPPLAIRCDSAIARARETRPRIAYLAADTIARQIAERLAALAGMAAAPLADREFDWALSDGREAGMVLALPLMNEEQSPAVFCDARITPLVEAHATLIMRIRP